MVASRRSVLRGLSTSLVTASFSTLWAPRHAAASDLSLSDRIDLLYSNQFHFNEKGEPQITIGLMEGQDVVRLSCPAGLDVLPSGDGGTRISAGTTITIRPGRTDAGKQTFSVVLEELVGPHAVRPGPAIERWKSKGFDPKEHEVGTIFGVSGHVLDNRRLLVTSGRFSSEREALAQSKKLKTTHGATGKLHPIVHSRASGSLTAQDQDLGVKVRADGVLWFAPRTGPITVHDVLSGTTMGKGTRSDRTYWGSIYVTVDRFGKLTVVNLVSESHVLAGLVPAEIYASAPMEALKSQAVAARGQLVTKVGTRHLADPYLLCAHQHCQVYAGRGKEHPRTTAAVEATAGWVAMRPGGTQLVDTVYSANSGGFTESNEHVWPGEPDGQLRGRPDPMLSPVFKDGIDESNIGTWLRSSPASFSRPEDEAKRAPYRWAATLDPSAIAGNKGVPAGLGPVRKLEVLARGRSGRATRLAIYGTRKRIEIEGELRIRRALGNLKSSMFIVLPDRDKFGRFQLLGGGHGHGVGMCQHGAMGMARGGRTFQQILAHYYRGSEITKLW